MSYSNLVSQGTLNRLIASLTLPDYPALNVSYSYLGESGINVALQGEAAQMLRQMSGQAVSLVPYLAVSMDVELNRAQALSATWYNQMLLNSAIGDIHVTPDTSTFPTMYFTNCAINNVGRLPFNGSSAAFGLSITGTLIVNSALWSAA